MYHSAYTEDYLGQLTARIRALAARSPVWCVFDNTARGAATINGLDLRARLDFS